MKINDFFEDNGIELNNKKFLVAASAGPDSMALLDMLQKMTPKRLKVIWKLCLVLCMIPVKNTA